VVIVRHRSASLAAVEWLAVAGLGVAVGRTLVADLGLVADRISVGPQSAVDRTSAVRELEVDRTLVADRP
jgi:hypothetical protein